MHQAGQWDLCKLLNHSHPGEGGGPGGQEAGGETKMQSLHLGDGAIRTLRPMCVLHQHVTVSDTEILEDHSPHQERLEVP